MKRGSSRKSYCEIMFALRKLLKEQYRDGGWLPPGREMALRLGVSHPTYCKALRAIQCEGLVNSFPQRGHCVIPDSLRPKKAGMIFNGGDDCPIIGDVVKCFELFNKSGYRTQVVQASSPDKLCERAAILGVEGLLWIFPPARCRTAVELIQAAGIPLAILCPPWDDSLEGVGQVRFDLPRIADLRVSRALERGYRSFAFIGTAAGAERSCLAPALRKAGFELGSERCFNDVVLKSDFFLKQIQRLGVSCIFSGGGAQLRFLCECLASLPEAVRPAILTDEFSDLVRIRKRFPTVELLDPDWTPERPLEIFAAEMLVKRLDEGAPLFDASVRMVPKARA